MKELVILSELVVLSELVILSEAKDLHADACRTLFGVARALRALLPVSPRGGGACASSARDFNKRICERQRADPSVAMLPQDDKGRV